jgi:hypothetical protein
MLPVRIEEIEEPLARHQHMSNLVHEKHIGLCATLHVIKHRLDLETKWRSVSLLSSGINSLCEALELLPCALPALRNYRAAECLGMHFPGSDYILTSAAASLARTEINWFGPANRGSLRVQCRAAEVADILHKCANKRGERCQYWHKLVHVSPVDL